MSTPLNPEAFDLACKELFLTITAHKSAADVLGFDWKSLKASTRKPWETATRKVLTAYLDEDGMEEANTRMAKILTDTANALKGEPEPLVTHSWHDLAEVAQRAVAQPVVNTVEELKALPHGVILIDDDGDVMRYRVEALGGNHWEVVGTEEWYSAPALPATVIYRPEQS